MFVKIIRGGVESIHECHTCELIPITEDANGKPIGNHLEAHVVGIGECMGRLDKSILLNCSIHGDGVYIMSNDGKTIDAKRF